MKIVNRTRYSTRELRTVVCRAYALAAKTEGKLKRWRQVKFTVVPATQRACSGWAYLGGYNGRLRVPKREVAAAPLFRLAWHEIMHLYGYTHRQFQTYPTAAETDAAVSDSVLYEQQPKAKPKLDRQMIRFERTLAGIARWQSKLKRAQNALRELNRRKRYYERVLPAAASRREKP